ncbi:MAG: DUF1566 domain-containing protein [Thermodesulfobacteriota bacterium]
MRARMILGLAAALVVAATDTGRAASPPAWDRVVPSGSSRFKVLPHYGGLAVLDKETGLVWQRSPATNLVTWENAQFACLGVTTGGRRGWRAPTEWELMSLGDPTQDTPSLSPGHPFQDVSTDDNYWSATTHPTDPTRALRERFGVGSGGVIVAPKGDLARVWCVRGPGGQSSDP